MYDEDDDYTATLLGRKPTVFSRPGKVVLEVLTGSQLGTRFTIDRDVDTDATAGRAHSHVVHLDDPSVSVNHFRLSLTARGVALEDLGSSNGTWTNDEMLIDRVVLTRPATFRAGDVKLRVESITNVDVSASAEMSFGDLHGVSDSMRELFAQLERISSSDLPFLIHGETGTGKELLAKALHKYSKRDGPYIAQNCGAIPRDLAEGLLFGHVKGAFSGAISDRPGAFEAARGGTLFLDEIGELPLDLQAKLLRVLEEREVTRVGEFKAQPVDVRVLAATHRDLSEKVAEGSFREDLYYRLVAAKPLRIPPLRHRTADIPFLAQLFARRHRKQLPLSKPALELLSEYRWAGNVRQLRNAVETAAEAAEGNAIERHDILDFAYLGERLFEPSQTQPRRSVTRAHQTLAVAMEQAERDYFRAVLEQHNGDLGAAAATSGFSNKHNLKKKLKRLGLIPTNGHG